MHEASRVGDPGSTAPVTVPPLVDLCRGDPLDLDSDPRLRETADVVAAPEPCGPLCTPWCLAAHGHAGRPTQQHE